MKRKEFLKYLLLLLFIAILISGCNKSVEIEDVSGDSNQIDSPKNHDSESGELEDEDLKQPEGEKDIEQNSIQQIEEKDEYKDLEQKDVASVIVKSENNLSDSEKEEIVSQLSTELDELLNEINSME